MQLYILRHGIAVDRTTTANDSARPLTVEGRREMRENAKGMLALRLTFDTILSSPYKRARETAAVVADILKIKTRNILLTENLVPEASFESLLKEIKTNLPKSDSILLVGHEPHLSGLISFLLIGRPSIAINFKKSGLCCLSIEKLSGPGCASLNWLLAPSQLRMIL